MSAPSDDAAPIGAVQRLARALEHGYLARGLLLAFACWILDQATKTLAVRTLSARVIDLPGPFHLHLVHNDGAAFGLNFPWWSFLIVTVIVAAVVVRNLPRASGWLDASAYALLLAGALGNVTDRLLRPPRFARGEVVDFIGSSVWPTFNIADVCITLGFILLVAGVFLAEHRERRRGESPSPAAA